jgi:hypothetical protein
MQKAYSAQEIRPDEESFIGLGLSNMAKSAQLGMPREELEPIGRARRTKVNPADNAGDYRIAFRQIEQVLGLFFRLIGLNGNRAVNTIRGALWREIARQEIPPDRLHFFGDPRITQRIVIPKMLMRVNSHPWRLKKPPSMG